VVARLGQEMLRRIALPSSGLYPVATVAIAMLAFAGAGAVEASGFAAIYVAALWLGNADLPHRSTTLGFVEALGDIGFVFSEIEASFGFGEQHQAAFAPLVSQAAEGAVGQGEGLVALAGGFSADEIGQAFDLREIHAAIGEGAAGIFAGFGQPDTGQRSEGVEHAGDDGGPAVQVEVGKVFAAGARGAGEDGDEGLIEQAIARVELAQAKAARWRDAAGQGLDRGKGGRARQANNGERSRWTAAGQRRNCIGHGRIVQPWDLPAAAPSPASTSRLWERRACLRPRRPRLRRGAQKWRP
jgi:hypothetical protein